MYLYIMNKQPWFITAFFLYFVGEGVSACDYTCIVLTSRLYKILCVLAHRGYLAFGISSVNLCIFRLKKFKNNSVNLEMMHLRSLVTSRHHNVKSSHQGVELTVEESRNYLHLCHWKSSRVSSTLWVLGKICHQTVF